MNGAVCMLTRGKGFCTLRLYSYVVMNHRYVCHCALRRGCDYFLCCSVRLQSFSHARLMVLVLVPGESLFLSQYVFVTVNNIAE